MLAVSSKLGAFRMCTGPAGVAAVWLVLTSLCGAHVSVLAADGSARSGAPTFEADVRPILKAYCFHCHGGEGELHGGLDLRLRRLIVAGGDSGPAIEPGNAAGSYLYERLQNGDMPPKNAQLRPTQAQVETIARWIAAGAGTARPEPETVDELPPITDEERRHWAFQPISRPRIPDVGEPRLARNPIDAFLLQKLEAHGLAFNAEAERQTLIRRAAFDLTGLPPEPGEVAGFVEDESDDAYERLIDRLLASPHYGERWGRHWLDVAGYSDSEGVNAQDTRREWAWKFRDYVIAAFNADKPVDRFLREQLAGDEMISGSFSRLAADEIEKLTATGFLRMAPDGTGGKSDDPMLARNQVVETTIDIVSSALLGLTVACAQCHDHRFDPILQKDYYRLRAVFEPAFNVPAWRVPQARLISLATDDDLRRVAEIDRQAEEAARELQQQLDALEQSAIDTVFAREVEALPEELRGQARLARDAGPDRQTPEQKKLFRDYPTLTVKTGNLHLHLVLFAEGRELQQQRDALKQKLRATREEFAARKPKWDCIQALTEARGADPATRVFHRGDWQQPGETVGPGDLTVLYAPGSRESEIPLDDPLLPTTGRRLAYARQLTNGRHPLVARVLVNRVWMHHFGHGIVATAGDFGTRGTPPTHPELLDWLSREFTEGGWSLKRLHRLIMTSAAYTQSSSRDSRKEAVDPDNRLYARMPVRRLDAETVRDAILAVSGDLESVLAGRPLPVASDAGEIVVVGDGNRRSVYVESRRTQPLSILQVFDAPAMQPNCTQRTVSTVAPQSLMLMNSPFILKQSEKFARRVLREAPGDCRSQVLHAWRLAFGTPPHPQEFDMCLELFEAQQAHYVSQSSATPVPADGSAEQRPVRGSEPRAEIDDSGTPDAETYALMCLCNVLLQSNQLLYVD